MRKCITLILTALLSATAFSAELLEADVAPDLMMKIWPGDAPDLGPVLRQETPWPNFAHVSSPELWVYLPETPATNRPAMVIFPGGSFIGVAMELHVYNVVKLFNDQGIAVIGVKYRTDYGDNDVVKDSLADCERAIRQVRYHAAEWGIDPNQICAQGYSAGSTVCMNLLGNYDDGDPASSDPVERFSSRPDRVALMCPWPNSQSATAYPMSTNPPPVFIASAEDDTAVPLAFVQDIGATLIRQGGRVEWFIVPTGGHFALHYGVSTGPGAEWPAAFKKIFPIKKVYVMLLGGQSNAMGLGYQRYLEETTNRLASPQTDIDLYVGSNTGNLPVNTILPLQSGSGDSRAAPFVPVYPEGTNAPVNRFGPELGMARTVRDRIAIPDSKVAIIKYAFGATRLYDHWRPDGTADSSGDGSFYQGFQSTVASGLVALHAKYPDHEIELLGMGWVQGESDILMGQAGDYQANLTTFVEDIRATYGTNMVFVLSKISPNQEPNNLADEYWFSDLDVVRNAQQAVADADTLVYATETIGSVYSVYPRHVDKGAIHFDSSAMLQIGEDLGTALMTLVNLNADDVTGVSTGFAVSPQLMEGEAVVFCSDLQTNSARLLFDPAEIQSVERADGSQVFTYGLDYTVSPDGWITLTTNSSIPVLDYYTNVTDSTYYRFRDTNGVPFYSPSGTSTHTDWDVVVNYTHTHGSLDALAAGTWQTKLDEPVATLRGKQPLNVTFFGDSITFGAQASSLAPGAPPYAPAYPSQVVAALKAQFGYEQINYANKAVGGKTSEWGLQEIQQVIDTSPDLVVLAFGMNDGSRSVPSAEYKSNTEGMIQALRAANPDVGIVLVAEFSPNPETANANYALRAQNRDALFDLYSAYPNMAFVDVGAVSRQIAAHKKFQDFSGNCLNHPNDFMHAVYADLDMNVFGEGSFAVTHAADNCTYVVQGAPDANWDGLTYIGVRGALNSGAAQYSVMEFPLTASPIAAATLRLKTVPTAMPPAWGSYSNLSIQIMVLSSNNTAFAEAEATYNNQATGISWKDSDGNDDPLFLARDLGVTGTLTTYNPGAGWENSTWYDIALNANTTGGLEALRAAGQGSALLYIQVKNTPAALNSGVRFWSDDSADRPELVLETYPSTSVTLMHL